MGTERWLTRCSTWHVWIKEESQAGWSTKHDGDIYTRFEIKEESNYGLWRVINTDLKKKKKESRYGLSRVINYSDKMEYISFDGLYLLFSHGNKNIRNWSIFKITWLIFYWGNEKIRNVYLQNHFVHLYFFNLPGLNNNKT